MRRKNIKAAKTFLFSTIENDSTEFVTSFRQDGFAVVRNILDDRVSTKLRADCIAIAKQAGVDEDEQFNLANAFGSHSSVASVLVNENVNLLINKLVDGERWGFWGHSDVSLNAEAPWHKDDGGENIEENYFGLDAIAEDSAEVIKFAIYFQDHSDDGGSLSVIPKSHRQYFPGVGTPIDTKATSNDIVVFDARITHRGLQSIVVPYLTFNRKLFIFANRINAMFTTSFRAFKKRIGIKQATRCALFFSVAKYGEITDAFGRNMVAHAERKGARIGGVHPKVKTELLKRGVFVYPE